jgi:predicted transglutaminase-like cysteine proteinase
MVSCVKRVFGLACLVWAFSLAAASAATNDKVLTEFGNSRPPIGYVLFCKRGADECKAEDGKIERLQLTDEIWNDINQVNTFVNSSIKPSSDIDLYHTTEFWAYPTTAGDCEDYVLLKKRLLVKLGFNADELLITVLLDEHGEGHAVLTVLTQNADLILDNRRDEVLSANQTNYKFLKRQSQHDPKLWVSLRKTDAQVIVGSQGK